MSHDFRMSFCTILSCEVKNQWVGFICRPFKCDFQVSLRHAIPVCHLAWLYVPFACVTLCCAVLCGNTYITILKCHLNAGCNFDVLYQCATFGACVFSCWHARHALLRMIIWLHTVILYMISECIIHTILKVSFMFESAILLVFYQFFSDAPIEKFTCLYYRRIHL